MRRDEVCRGGCSDKFCFDTGANTQHLAQAVKSNVLKAWVWIKNYPLVDAQESTWMALRHQLHISRCLLGQFHGLKSMGATGTTQDLPKPISLASDTTFNL
jgi:hypothetical protein